MSALTSPIHNPGWTVSSQAGGGSEDGRVSWNSTGHQILSLAGWSAVLSQISTYVGARSAVAGSAICHVSASGGYYNTLNADLAGQQAAVAAILANPANVSGSAI